MEKTVFQQKRLELNEEITQKINRQ